MKIFMAVENRLTQIIGDAGKKTSHCKEVETIKFVQILLYMFKKKQNLFKTK